jgi:hypothetical protein
MNEQPEALRLAECLERDCQMNWPDYDNQMDAAAELRRLHALNQELLEALEGVMYWDNGKPEWEDARAAIAKAGETK